MAVIDSGTSTSGKANVDANYNLNVTLPTTDTQAGFARLTFLPGGSAGRDLSITAEGEAYVQNGYQLMDLQFNSASTTWATKIGTNATTMTKAPTNGYMRLNSGSSTTTAQGISIYTNRTFNLEEGVEMRVKFYVRHANAAATNKQADAGLGYYAFAAGQAAAMNDFIGFRWTTTGGLMAVVETSQGGAPTSQTTNINSNVPFSDNVTREYEIIVTDAFAEFYVAGVYQTRISRDPGSWSLLKGISLPFMARVFNSGAASAAMTFDLASVSVIRMCGEVMPQPLIAAVMGKSSYYFQPDVTAASAATHLFPASGTAPTAAVGSNTASAANNVATMGGIIRNTLTGVTVTLSTNILWTAYQNPAIPTTAGVATNARNLIITGINIGPMVVTAALTGGGFTAAWFAAIGTTATSLATTDADGTTAVAQKAPRFVPLTLVSTLAATAALGVVSTDVGDHQFVFRTPLVVHPGEFISIGMRTIAVTAAVTAGSADCMIGVNGYWE